MVDDELGRLAAADGTALQLDVPAAWPALEAVAALGLDGAVLLRPPHVSLAWPWLDGSAAAAALDEVAAGGARWAPFELMLSRVEVFAARGGAAVVHLVPREPEPVRALTAVLPGGSTDRAHLSVARVARGDVGAARAALAPLLPLRVRAATVEVRARVRGNWEVVRRLPLGGTAG